MLAAHPKLRVIGCHLGSMEHDVDEIAKRLDRYPNFAVDTAARVVNLMAQPREKVRAFLIKYQDRVLWGTDLMEITWDDPGRDAGALGSHLCERLEVLRHAETINYGSRQCRACAATGGSAEDLPRQRAALDAGPEECGVLRRPAA